MKATVTRVYLDTNIFIYALEETISLDGSIARFLIAATRGSQSFVTSELSLSELLVKPHREADGILINRYENFIQTSAWLNVPTVSRSVLAYAAVLRAKNKGLKLPDAIHLSTAIGSACSHFLTADTGILDSYDLLHPLYGGAESVQPLRIVRPDTPTLTSLLKSLAS